MDVRLQTAAAVATICSALCAFVMVGKAFGFW
jgi:hypothetical protein